MSAQAFNAEPILNIYMFPLLFVSFIPCWASVVRVVTKLWGDNEKFVKFLTVARYFPLLQSVLDHLSCTLILWFQWVTGAFPRSKAVRA